MAISGHEQAQITARLAVLRLGTGRLDAAGDAEQIYLDDSEAPKNYAGEFKYTESPEGDTPEDDPEGTDYTNVAK